MIRIKKIVSMCPAPQGWRSIHDDEGWAEVAAWVLIELEDSSREIVAMTGSMCPSETINQLNLERKHCIGFEFVEPSM